MDVRILSDKEIVRIGYDKVAKKYLQERNEELLEMNLLIEFAKSLKEHSRILDAGCGAGLPFTKYLSQMFEVVGIDFSEKQIELAKKNVTTATFHQMDITNLDFPDESFDVIISYYAIIHIPREEHESIFKNFYRILKPHGKALLTLHPEDDPGSYNEDFFGEKMYWSGFDPKISKKLLEDAGFFVEKIVFIPDSLGADNKHPFFFLKKE